MLLATMWWWQLKKSLVQKRQVLLSSEPSLASHNCLSIKLYILIIVLLVVMVVTRFHVVQVPWIHYGTGDNPELLIVLPSPPFQVLEWKVVPLLPLFALMVFCFNFTVFILCRRKQFCLAYIKSPEDNVWAFPFLLYRVGPRDCESVVKSEPSPCPHTRFSMWCWGSGFSMWLWACLI